MAAYGFEEGSGTTTADASGSGRTATLAGPVWQRGKFGNALSFNGATDSVTIPDAAALQLTTGMTLSVWVLPTAPVVDHPPLITKGVHWPADYGLYGALDSGLPSVLVVADGQAGIAAGSSTLPLGVWTHLATTYDGSTLSLYVDGTLMGTEPLVDPIDTSIGPLRIGGNDDRYQYFAGLIDEVRVYDRALSSAELASDMASALTPAGPALPIILGESSVLPSDDAGNGNLMVAQEAFLEEAATIQSLSLYITNAVGQLRMGIYAADEPDGDPGTKLAETAELTPTVGWNTANLTSPVVLQPGAYWLVYLPSDSELGIRVAGVGSYAEFPFAFGPMPATYSTPTDRGSFRWSFYASGVPAVAGGCMQGGTPAPSGTACSDGNPCNGAETCDGAGNCAAGTPVVCTALDQCHMAGTCNPASGQCSNPTEPDGTTCNDGSACTQTDTCQAGACTGGSPVVCVAIDPCHEVGTCSPGTGVCSNPARVDGTNCNDGDACTSGDSCGGGICVAGSQVPTEDQNPCTIDACDPSTGVVHTPAAVGTSCSDGNACNGVETCSAVGGCQSGTPPNVDDGNVCTADACNPQSGSVTHTALPGTSCGPSATCQADGTCQENGTPPEAPALDDTVPSDINDVVKFLYTGPNAVQQGLDTTFLDQRRTALVRGRVIRRDGTAIPGASIRVADQPKYGYTLTQGNGEYSLVVNGGGPVRIAVSLSGYLPVERTARPTWNSYRTLDDIALTPLDAVANIITLPSEIPQVAFGSTREDVDGVRRAQAYFPQGTSAVMIDQDGVAHSLEALTVRATEYTVGANGPKAMPAPLPPSSAYTYAVELSVDEAMAAGAEQVVFDQPVSFYVDNFLNFPVGVDVPSGFFDRTKGAWVPLPNGRVIQIIGVEGNLASIDVDGDGQADTGPTLLALGITDEERGVLAATRESGTSLWRAQLAHFTPCDLNWGLAVYPCELGGVCADDKPPERARVDLADDSCATAVGGSVIECQTQVLRETLPLPGTPFSLNYRSSRVLGYAADRTLTISLIGDRVPQRLIRVEATIQIGGRRFAQAFPGSSLEPDASAKFIWDSRDAFGRVLNGEQTAHIQIRHVYPILYVPPRVFGGPPAGPAFSEGRLAAEYSLDWESDVGMGGARVSPASLGGWMLSRHHGYEPNERALYLGTGERVPTEQLGLTIAHESDYQDERGIEEYVFAPNGFLYFVGKERKVWRFDPEKSAAPAHFAYAGSGIRAEEGVLATTARANSPPTQIAIGPEGSVYFAEWDHQRVRRVAPDGRIWTVAGSLCPSSPGGPVNTGCVGREGDGGPATAARLNYPKGVAVGDDGTVFISDSYNNVIRVVDPGGTIRTLAGTGAGLPTGDRSQDGLLAVNAAINHPSRLILGPDGSLYCQVLDVSNLNRYAIIRISPNGILTYVTGPQTGPVVDGTPARSAPLPVGSFDVSPNGSIAIIGGNKWIWEVEVGGLVRTLAGKPWEPNPAPTDFGRPALGSNLFLANRLALSPRGNPVGSGGKNFVRLQRVTPPTRLGCPSLVPAPSGEELYCFDAQGRHLSTLDPRTQAVVESFEYANGMLSAIVDSSGNRTTLERNASEGQITVRGPFGHTSVLTVNRATGFAESLRDPTGATTEIRHSQDGLLASVTDAALRHHEFLYDDAGRLVRDTDPAGGYQTLEREDFSTTVARTTATGRETLYDVTVDEQGIRHSTITHPDGGQEVAERRPDLTSRTSSPDGTVLERTLEPDPRFGMIAPFVSIEATTLPSQLQSRTVRTRNVATDSAGRVTSAVDSVNVNGATTTYAYAQAGSAAPTYTVTSPLGRKTTATLDEVGRLRGLSVAGLNPMTFDYDNHGRLFRAARGTRVATIDFSNASDLTKGYPTDLSDATGPVEQWTPDAYGRPLALLDAKGQSTQLGYDFSGNLLTLAPPGQPGHAMTYSPVDLLTSYTPPPLANEPESSESWEFNLDRALILHRQPAGITVVPAYDNAGRLTTITAPSGTAVFSYYPTSCVPSTGCAPGRLQSATSFDGTQLTFGYDGAVTRSVAYSGPFAAFSSQSYNANFRATSSIVVAKTRSAGVGPIIYDADGLVTCLAYGVTNCIASTPNALRPTYDAANGLLTGSTMSSVSEQFTRDAYGQLASQAAQFAGSPLLSIEYASAAAPRDTRGRVVHQVEAKSGSSSTIDYEYDAVGQLVRVSRNGTISAEYGYDANGNRLSATRAGTTTSGTYDARDRLLAYGDTSYTYTPRGEVHSRLQGGASTTYEYDENGQLARVHLADDTVIRYLMDVFGRRVGKQVNGTASHLWVYGVTGQLMAELDGSGTMRTRFVYATRPNVPDFIVRYSGSSFKIYRLIADQLGSPRMLVNIADVADQPFHAAYDEFGRVTGTGLDFIPFGFAGGQYDPVTGLVRFGAREYDAATGRWMQRDPILFGGAQANIYAYVGNDPINFSDPTGLKDWSSAEVQELLSAYQARLTQAPLPYLLMASLHAGGGDLDFYVNAPSDTFALCGETMDAAQFGNFIAGFAAGVLDDPLAYWLVRGAGSIYGFGAGALGYAPPGEWRYLGDNQDSVRHIDAGLNSGQRSGGTY